VLAERIRSAVEVTRVISLSNGIEFEFTVSIGVAEQRADDCTEQQLLGLADEALYLAKTAGRNRVNSITRK
jgi:diguanylate cyclase (GGDEF)-like protein